MASKAPHNLRARKPHHVLVLRSHKILKRNASDHISQAQAPRTRISKVRTNVPHDGACQMKSLNDCSSKALHELSCGHLFCSECIVAHLKANKRKRDYRPTRRRSISVANLNMKQRKLVCFLCRKIGQCGCCKPAASESASSNRSPSEGCYIKPPGGMCVHLRQRSNCKQCSKNVCPHNKVKHFCKDCGGCAYCEHGKAKQVCRQCKLLKQGGGSICEHDKIRTNCKDCGGGSLCQHMRHRSNCRDCGGSQICKHGRAKYSCTKCKGAGVCEHGTLKQTCKVCRGSSWCSHGRLKKQCRECGGSVFCHHNKRWRVCRCIRRMVIASKPRCFHSRDAQGVQGGRHLPTR